MIWLFIITGLLIILGVILLAVARLQQRQFGALKNDRVYQDTEAGHGQTLYSQTTNLVGRPDYIVKEHSQFIPVEIKTGKTPSYPYRNHIMQLTAYCLLVEENYNRKPAYGYIKYPEREFKVFYTPENKRLLERLVETITSCKISNTELHCNHPQHNFDISFSS